MEESNSRSTQLIGRYIIISELGRGGHAIVYRAYDPSINREVAIKVLKSSFLNDDELRARFEREVQTIAAIEHPAIVPVYDFGEENGQPYIVMRLMSGGSLSDRLKSEEFSIQRAAQIFDRIAPALDLAHSKGIIHRDLKPGNILFDQFDNAYISDFGIARIVEASTEWTTGVIGTPAYMSPEQVQNGREIDARSDIYALGVIFYQMLVGTTPYHSDTPAKILMMHILEPVPSILGTLPELPSDIETWLQIAMAKEPDDRFSTAGDMADALQQAIENSKEVSQMPVRPRMTQEFPAHKWTLLAIALITIIIISFAIFYIASNNFNLIAKQNAPTSTQRSSVASPNTVTPSPIAQEKPSTFTPFPSFTPLPPTHTDRPTKTLYPTITDTKQIIETLTQEISPTVTVAGMKTSLKDNMVQIYIPAGEFIMGQYGGEDNPQHPVYLDAFWIDQTEVTNAQYALCVANGNCEPPHLVSSATRANYYGNETYADYPVIEVSWLQAKNYCHWAGRSLPTEAQWEKAARGTDGRRHPWGDERLTRDLVNYGNDVYKDTVDVFSLPRDSSFYNVLMMGGNVSEWVLDWYGVSFYTDSVRSEGVANNPQGPNSGENDNKVMRGSAWITSDAPNTGARVDVRYPTNPSLQLNYVGFRCAEPVP